MGNKSLGFGDMVNPSSKAAIVKIIKNINKLEKRKGDKKIIRYMREQLLYLLLEIKYQELGGDDLIDDILEKLDKSTLE